MSLIYYLYYMNDVNSKITIDESYSIKINYFFLLDYSFQKDVTSPYYRQIQ